MNKLFIRIWLANWAVFALVVFISVVVFHQYVERQQRLQQPKPPLPPHILKEDLLLAVEQGETPEQWLQKISTDNHPVYLLDPQGKDLLAREYRQSGNANKRVARDRPYDKAMPVGDGHAGEARKQDMAARLRERIYLPGYPELRLVSFPPPRREPFNIYSPGVLIVLAFLASGLAARILARYITFPIKQLYLASVRVAQGDFQTDVAAVVGKRQDEIAELARCFDAMALALEKSHDAQKELLRDASHELRSPLTRIRLMADMFDGASADELQHLQQRLKKELAEMEVLIDEVMGLAHFEAESDSLQFEVLNVREVITTTVDDAMFEAEALNKTVVFRSAKSCYRVSLAPAQFTRAMENILRNAIRHTPENSEVHVDIAVSDGHVDITVSDAGDGVNDDELEKIFLPFYRSAQARAQFKGAGVGLALTERIVRHHNGSIVARNIAPRGLEVRIRLPLA